MKWSHVIVAIVFFILGAASMLVARVTVAVRHEAPKLAAPVADAAKGQHSAVTSGTAVGGVFMGKTFGIEQRAVGGGVSFRIERHTNRHGADYRDFEMAKNAADADCQKACADDLKCRAFTFVKAGAAPPHCWLKNSVPQAYGDERCISGVRQ